MPTVQPFSATAPLKALAGTAAEPSITFTGNTGSGFYSPGANQVAVTTDGTPRLLIDENGSITVANKFSVPLGTKELPSIFFGSDINTGIYSPGADQVAVATNGTQALYINADGDILVADGNRMEIDEIRARDGAGLKLFDDAGAGIFVQDGGAVGIGTSGPQYLAHIFGGSDSSANNLLTVQSNGVASDGTLSTNIRLINSTATSSLHGAEIRAIRAAATSSDLSIRLYDTSGSFQDKVYIKGDGKVGIGSNAPARQLTVYDSSTPIIQLVNSTTGQTANDGVMLYESGSNFVIENQEAGEIQIYNNGSQRAAIDSSGRLLVGTSSNLTSDPLQVSFSQADSLGGLSLTNQQWYGYGCRILFQAKNNSAGDIKTLGAVTGQSDGANAGRLVFSTTADGASSPTERVRISQTGYTKFGISGSYEGGNIYEFNGGENGGACLVVRWTPSGLNSGNAFIVKTPNTAAATTHNLIAGDSSAGNIFRVRADGNVYNTNGVYGSISDIKLKENIVSATSQWNDIKALQIRKYNFKEGLTHTQIGLIAQEVEEVSPGLVYETPDRDKDGNETGEVTKGVNYSVLYMKAVKALQEAMERIEQLESKVAALENA